MSIFLHTHGQRLQFNMHINFMSIGFLVADLGFLAMRIKQIVIVKFKIILNNPCDCPEVT